MKRNLINAVMTVALLLFAVNASAAGKVIFVQEMDGEIGTYAQDIQQEIKEGVCTLTVSGIDLHYSVQSVDVVRLINGNYAQSRKNIPDIDNDPIAVTKTGEGVYTFNVSGEYDYEATIYFTYRLYGITVNGIAVDGSNLLDILDNKKDTVAYNGNGTLILTNVTAEDLTIESAIDGELTLYVKGNSKLLSITTTSAKSSLLITTDPQAPGVLVLGKDGNESPAISGFHDVSLDSEAGLVWRTGDATAPYAVVGTIIKPMNEDTEVAPSADDMDPDKLTPAETVTGNPEDTEDKTLVMNKVIDDIIVVTLVVKDEDGNPVDVFEEDAVEGNKDAFLLSTVVEGNDLEKAQKEEPGTEDYAKYFNGITFKLAGGSGVIEIEVDVPEGSQLMVKVGEDDPAVFTDTTGVVQIPYVCETATCVYIYNGTSTNAGARGMFRAKIKTAPIKVVSINVSPSSVRQSPPPENDAKTEKTLTSAEISDAVDDNPTLGNVFSMEDEDLTTLDGDAFESLNEEELYCIDLSKTSIRNVEVDRSAGPFKGIDPKTFIYLPAGNSVKDDEPNVVIGGICKNMVLTGDDKPFAPIMNFGVTSATLDRNYVQGQTSTVYLPFAVDKNSADALGTFYTFEGIGADGDAELKAVTTGLAANTPYIFQKTANGKVTVKNVSVTTDAKPVTTELIGTFEPITWYQADLDAKAAQNKYIYGFAAAPQGDNISAGEFVQVGSGASIKPYRAYLELGISASRIAINWGDNTTGISEVRGKMNEATDGWYTINGIRLSKAPVKAGLYIHNGKKTIVNK